jgi:hypothetical protein
LLYCTGLAAQPGTPTTNWKLLKTVDKMTDKRVCTLTYAKNPFVRYSSSDFLFINYYGRGGVSAFRYRIDANPVSEFHLTKRYDNDEVSVQNYNGELSEATRLIVQGMTVLKKGFEHEIDLTGLKQARAKMAEECGLDPIQIINIPPRPSSLSQ